MSFYTQEELLRDETYWTIKIQLDLFRQIEDYLEANHLSRKEFAQQLGVSKGYVSQILNGNYDHKLSKFVSLCLAVNKAPKFVFQDLDVAVDRAKHGPKKIERTFTVNAPNMQFHRERGHVGFTPPIKVDTKMIKLPAA